MFIEINCDKCGTSYVSDYGRWKEECIDVAVSEGWSHFVSCDMELILCADCSDTLKKLIRNNTLEKVE